MILARGWLVAAVPEGLLCTLDGGPSIEVDFDDAETPERLVELLRGPGAVDGLEAVLAASDAKRLTGTLVAAGALVPSVDRAGRAALPERMGEVATVSDAVLAAQSGDSLPRAVATASELLAVPAGLAAATARRLLRAFVAGFEAHPRVRAYGHVALTGRRTVAGDEADPDALAAAIATVREEDPSHVHVARLDGSPPQSVEPAALDRIGAGRIHRLGTVVGVAFPGPPPRGAPNVRICMARQAHPNLRFPGSGHGHSVGIGATEAEAELIARAEAAERFACGDVSGHPLERAIEADLDAPILRPDQIVRYSARQTAERWGGERHEPAHERLWVAGRTLAGERRWVPAEMAFNPFADPRSPGPLPPVTSSGSAAHRTLAEAASRGLGELIERDAFMWHWVQRLSRERVDPASLPDLLRRRLRDLVRAGHEVDLVNLTLDTRPVILCALRAGGLLSVAAACREDAVEAAAKALHEAAAVLWSPPGAIPGPGDPEAVRTPLEHLALYRDRSLRDRAAFLWSGDDRIAIHDVTGSRERLSVALGRIGEPLVVDMTSPGSRPFHVARTFVPGLVPLSFGFDREPLGVPRLAAPIALPDGRRLGGALDLHDRGPIVPHPFP